MKLTRPNVGGYTIPRGRSSAFMSLELVSIVANFAWLRGLADAADMLGEKFAPEVGAYVPYAAFIEEGTTSSINGRYRRAAKHILRRAWAGTYMTVMRGAGACAEEAINKTIVSNSSDPASVMEGCASKATKRVCELLDLTRSVAQRLAPYFTGTYAMKIAVFPSTPSLAEVISIQTAAMSNRRGLVLAIGLDPWEVPSNLRVTVRID